MIYNNPIIPGFNPDPSICRVGDDFYLVTSTFEFFPGVPIYHSKNLVNWELIGHCLNTEQQLPLKDCRASGGIYAPTIRFHNGTFYMTTTNVTNGGNFIVHTNCLEKGWSEPFYVDQGGIDPSLFFDDDGTVYFCSNAEVDGQHGIAICQINPDNGTRLTPIVHICSGSGGRYVEGPHIYKRNGKYYLMLAEGGTEYGHMETIFRSDSPYGPYEPCPHNPILTHRNAGWHPIQCTGHADMVEDSYGNSWLVCLGVRPLPGRLLHHLGRETFLAPVIWDEDGWPVVGNKGLLSLEMDAPLPGEISPVSFDFYDDFSSDKLNPRWSFIRNPIMENYKWSTDTTGITLRGSKYGLSSQTQSPTFLGIRQNQFSVAAQAEIIIEAMGENGKAGLSAFYNYDYHYDIYVTIDKGKYWICLNKKIHDIEVEVAKKPLESFQKIQMQICANPEEYVFSYCTDKGTWTELGRGLTTGLCTETTHMMTFTGTFLGIFCYDAVGKFSYFKYKTERGRSFT